MKVQIITSTDRIYHGEVVVPTVSSVSELLRSMADRTWVQLRTRDPIGFPKYVWVRSSAIESVRQVG